MVISQFSKMAAAAILDFKIFEILMVGTVKRVELHHRAKFWPPSWICDVYVQTTHEEHLVVFITVQNLAAIDAVVLIMFFSFVSLACKCLVTPPKFRF